MRSASRPPEPDESDRAITRETFSAAAEVIVRDHQSKLVLEDVGVTRPISVTADPALLLPPADWSAELLRTETVPAGAPLVGMNVRKPGRAFEYLDQAAYHKLLANLGDFMARRMDAYVVFVPVERDDVRHAHAVAPDGAAPSPRPPGPPASVHPAPPDGRRRR